MTEEQVAGEKKGSILVVGGGISGLTATLEAAEVGYEVFLVEKNPSLRHAALRSILGASKTTPESVSIPWRRFRAYPGVLGITM